MLKEDNLIIGLAIGICLPVIVWLLFDYSFEGLEILGLSDANGQPIRFKDRTIALLAVCANLIPFYRLNSRRYEKTLRGIVIATSLYVILWFINFGLPLLRGELS